MGYSKINVDSSSQSGGSGGGGTFSKQFNANSDWIGPAAGFYTITIPSSEHGLGSKVDPEVYEGDQKVETAITVDSSGNVQIGVSASPDGRFAGKIIIDK